MNRRRDLYACPTCRQAPKPNDGRGVCGCPGQLWYFKRGVAGSKEDGELLRRHGWHSAESRNDIYWVGPNGNILCISTKVKRGIATLHLAALRDLRSIFVWYSETTVEVYR